MGSASRRKQFALAALACAATVMIGLLIARSPAPIAGDFSEILAAIRAGRPDAFLEAEAFADQRWAEVGPALPTMLEDPVPAARVAACRLIGRHGGPEWSAALAARAADLDWSVRAAAFEAMQRLGPPLTRMPLRDTPMAERERIILDWAAAHPPAAELCEVYARSQHLELNATMAARCVACHVGPADARFTHASCHDCHADVHAQWESSAHARTLSHLRYATVDPVTRQGTLWGWGARRGIDCTACHAIDRERTGGAAAEGACRFVFTAQPVEQTCGGCHGPAAEQWAQWRSHPQPRAATWPPGAVRLSPPVDRTCADCHMPAPPDADGPPAHRWAARRDPELLRGGLHLAVAPDPDPTGPPQVVLRLTNLAGHAYPTGSSRRALDVQISLNGRPYETLLRFSPHRPAGDPRLTDRPALAPAETVEHVLAVPADADRLIVRLLYTRDRFAAEPWSMVIETRPVSLR